MSKITIQVRLYPTPEQARLLMAHGQEYISTVKAHLPSAVKNQALRDAYSVFKRSLDLGCIPLLKKPICQWSNQNWRMDQGMLLLPLSIEGKVEQTRIRCADICLPGRVGILRIKKKRGKWIADIALTIQNAPPTDGKAIMGIDLGIKVPAVAHIRGQGTRFFGNGRYQRMMRRRFYAQRKKLQKAKKTRIVKKRQNKESRWMKDINHKLSRQIVNHAHSLSVGTIKVESLAGIRKGTTRTSRGASARKNNRMKNTWSFYQLTLFVTYKAQRLGIKVEQIDPAHTSQECPACSAHNKAQDRTYVCAECGWRGHRDSVGAMNISRRAGLSDKRIGATGA